MADAENNNLDNENLETGLENGNACPIYVLGRKSNVSLVWTSKDKRPGRKKHGLPVKEKGDGVGGQQAKPVRQDQITVYLPGSGSQF